MRKHQIITGGNKDTCLSLNQISSGSNCTDFQSRRLNILYEREDGSLQYAHTVRGRAGRAERGSFRELFMKLSVSFLGECYSLCNPSDDNSHPGNTSDQSKTMEQALALTFIHYRTFRFIS